MDEEDLDALIDDENEMETYIDEDEEDMAFLAEQDEEGEEAGAAGTQNPPGTQDLDWLENEGNDDGATQNSNRKRCNHYYSRRDYWNRYNNPTFPRFPY